MSNKRLLLVEDDRALADLVTFHFERAGYDVSLGRATARRR